MLADEVGVERLHVYLAGEDGRGVEVAGDGLAVGSGEDGVGVRERFAVQIAQVPDAGGDLEVLVELDGLVLACVLVVVPDGRVLDRAEADELDRKSVV